MKLTLEDIHASAMLGDHGYEIRHDLHGYYACTHLEGEHEDAGNPSVGFDGRSHYRGIAACANAQIAVCEGRSPEPEVSP